MDRRCTMKQSVEKYRNVLSECDIFRGIDADRLMALLDTMQARVVHYARGETICRYGDEVRVSALVLEGTVVVEASDAEGEDTNLNMLGKGDEFGAFLVVSGNMRCPMHIYAGTRCTLLLLDLGRMGVAREKSEETWQLMNNIAVSIAGKCVDLYQKVQIFGKKRIRSRIKLYLMGLDIVDGEVTLPMNRTALAAYLGVDRTALAREFSRMQQEGLIEVDKRRVRILNSDTIQPNIRNKK